MDAPRSRAFSVSELVQCGACARANPPTRASCLYCGAALEISALNAFSALPIRKAEISSEVFHVVAIARVQIKETALNQLAELLNVKRFDLELLLAHPAGAPMLAVNSERQAQTAAAKLHELGVSAHYISDKQLAVEAASASVSALQVHDDGFVGTVGRNKQTVAASWDEITLVVIGRLYFETKEIDQKRTRAKQIIDEREMLTDEAVLDIYARDDSHGWRIRAAGFNFSCLGEDKKLTTFENFTALTSLLREHATAAVFDDWYVRLRSALDSVWPREPVTSGKKRRRAAFGDFDSSVTSIDNELQFTRYSRLVRYLHASKSEDHAAQI